MLHAALLAMAALTAQPAPDIEALAWLEGHWREEDTRHHNRVRFVEEHWLEPAAGAIFGVNRTVRDGATTMFEYMRIIEEEGGLVFMAQPGGAPAARFPMISHGPGEVVFANPAHDYPQRIVYRRAGDTLTGTVSLIDGSRPMRWTFRLERPR